MHSAIVNLLYAISYGKCRPFRRSRLRNTYIRTGRYYCYQGPLEGQSFRSKAAAREALGNGSTQPSPSKGRHSAYERDAYGDWRDLDGDCQGTRDEMLIKYAQTYELGPRGCEIDDGL